MALYAGERQGTITVAPGDRVSYATVRNEVWPVTSRPLVVDRIRYCARISLGLISQADTDRELGDSFINGSFGVSTRPPD